MTVRLPALLGLIFLIAGIRGQEDFDLGAALDDPTVEPTPEKENPKTNPPVKPDDGPKPATSAPKSDPKPGGDYEDFDLGDGVGGDAVTPDKKPQPGQGGGGDHSFGDGDLFDGDLPPDDPSGTDGKQKGGEDEVQGPEKQSVVAGVLSALGVAAVGAVSSFIAYQKKKLCFKGQAEDPENVNMDNQKGDQNDPQAQTNLLAK